MIYRIELITRTIKRQFSRNRFLVWLFGLSKSLDTSSERGIIFLQIDGLSKHELHHAIDNGYMPFTKKILQKEHYKLHSLYSGVPASTPAAQGELFYGVKGCVPAFRFKRPQDKRAMAMLEPSLAKDIQAKLEKQGEPLLTGGSAFSDMFDGGAQEASFCASSMGWPSIMPSKNFFKMVIFIMLNIVSIVKVAVLVVVELGLAMIDIVRGILAGLNVIQEIKFVPARIATAVLLRELVTIGINLDSARGMPVIHGNYLSYDEQSHRRGPNSRFAHWALKGIDRSIARVWKAAKQSEYREYDVWIYSDHGQEKTRNYPKEFGENLHTSVNRVLTSYMQTTINQESCNSEIVDDPNLQRMHLLGSKKINRWLLNKNPLEKDDLYVEFSIAAMGPLGFLYLEQELNDVLRVSLAADLASKANVPMVVSVLETDRANQQASIWTSKGRFSLPADKKAIFGHDHPFLEEVCDDFIALSHHEYAGDFVLCGWSKDSQPISLRIENGAHAGPGKHETHTFALLPEDLTINERNSSNSQLSYLRFLDLRQAAQQQLKQFKQHELDLHQDSASDESTTNKTKHVKIEQNGQPLANQYVLNLAPKVKASQPFIETVSADNLPIRVMTYNVHHCMGMDGRLSPLRIARVISMYEPDVIALQEVHSYDRHSKFSDQAGLLANELGMYVVYSPVKRIAGGYFGNAILSKYPFRVIESRQLNSDLKLYKRRIVPFKQARGFIEVEVNISGSKFTVINTHLGLTAEDRRAQVIDLLSSRTFEQQFSPAILCGDFNATPRHNAYKMIKRVMQDIEEQTPERLFRKTFPTRYPVVRLDHIFVNRHIKVDVVVPANHVTKVASDHLPLVADLELGSFLKKKMQ